MREGLPEVRARRQLGDQLPHAEERPVEPWLDREHRCVVPAMAFAEPNQNTRKGTVM